MESVFSERISDTLLRFHITAQGDRTVGDGAHYAIVDIPYAVIDTEYVAATKENLTKAFEKIFDARNVRVLTDEEWFREVLSG
jgi:hypothetical protein